MPSLPEQLSLGIVIHSDESEKIKYSWLLSFIIAIFIVAIQISVVLYQAGPGSIVDRYMHFARWDTGWYESIVDNGYLANFPVNIMDGKSVNLAFFPAYPLSGFLVKKITGLQTKISLGIASQMAAVGFWMYFLLLLRKHKIPWQRIAPSIVVILAFPSAFYLVLPYTEALFMMMLMGFLYWIDDKRKHAWWIAGLHGFVMSATRIVGTPLAILPLLYFFCAQKEMESKRKMIMTAIMTCLGSISFFLFVQLIFGNWKIPIIAQYAWGVRANYWGLIDPKFYKIFIPSLQSGILDPNQMSAIAFPIALLSIIAFFCMDTINSVRRHSNGFSRRLIFYVAAGILWYTYAGARYTNTTGGIRYMLAIFILMVLATIHFCDHWKKDAWSKSITEILFPALSVFLTFIQLGYIKSFTHGGWVA